MRNFSQFTCTKIEIAKFDRMQVRFHSIFLVTDAIIQAFCMESNLIDHLMPENDRDFMIVAKSMFIFVPENNYFHFTAFRVMKYNHRLLI